MIREHEDLYAGFPCAAVLLVSATLMAGGRRGAVRSSVAVKVLVALLLGAILMQGASAQGARELMQQGLQEYAEGLFMEAAESFRNAALQAEEAGRDPARAWHNRGNALYQQGRFEEAADAYRAARQSTDLDVQPSAYYNHGNALSKHAVQLAEEENLLEAKKRVEQALESYRDALTLVPDDVDAKRNYEWADRFREELEELIAQQPPQPEPHPGDEEDPERPDDEQPEESEPDPDEDERREDEAEPDPAPEDPEGVPEEVEPGEVPPETMDELKEEEALMMLDALRDEEQEAREQMELRLGEPEEVEKDW